MVSSNVKKLHTATGLSKMKSMGFSPPSMNLFTIASGVDQISSMERYPRAP
jgi:hypothetical protein